MSQWGLDNPPCNQCPQPKLVDIDTSGDLLLEVGVTQCPLKFESQNFLDADPRESPHEHRVGTMFHVCSKAMARASQAFDPVMMQNLAELTNDGYWKVLFPGDDAGAMETVLNIIHCRFDKVPVESVTHKQVYHIVLVTNKYDLTHLLRPWAAKWMEKLNELWDPMDSTVLAEYHAWITWQLGDRDGFRSAVREIAATGYLNEDGYLCTWSFRGEWTECFDDILEPPGVYAIVIPLRLQMLKAMHDPVKICIDLLKDRPCCGKGRFHGTLSGVLGSVVLAMTKREGIIWPLPDPETSFMSPEDLFSELMSLTPNNSDCDAGCGFGWRTVMNHIMDKYYEITSELSEMQIRHLEDQAMKTGLSEQD